MIGVYVSIVLLFVGCFWLLCKIVTLDWKIDNLEEHIEWLKRDVVSTERVGHRMADAIHKGAVSRRRIL